MNKVAENPLQNRQHRTFVIMVAAMVTFYLTANVMAVKLINIHGITLFDAGTIVFPITYMLGDVFTELWGFRTTRRVILLTFVCQVLFAFFAWVGTLMPYPAETVENAEAYARVFNFVPRIMGASLAAFLIGELTNAWTFELIRKRTGRQHLWIRTIGSSVFGFILDTAIFVCIAFWGTVPSRDIVSMILIQIGVKLAIEALASTPLAYHLLHRIHRSWERAEEAA